MCSHRQVPRSIITVIKSWKLDSDASDSAPLLSSSRPRVILVQEVLKYQVFIYGWLSTSVLGGEFLINFVIGFGCGSGTGEGWMRELEIIVRSR